MSESSLPKVIVDGPLAEPVVRLLADKVELLPWSVLDTGAADVTGVYTFGHPYVGAAEMDRLPALRVISNYGVGVDHIDVAAAMERKIPVGNTPGVLDGATADHAMTLLLAAARRLIEGDRYARGPEFTAYDPGYMLGREVHGATLGIVGLGRIGVEIARRARGFNMRVLYYNRHRRPDEEQLGVEYMPFSELLEVSDYIVLSTPLTEQTRGMIGWPEIERMKRTAILVNIGRGPLVVTSDLTEALQQRRIYAAALDVTDPEPLPRDHPLLKLNNVVLAPHLGSATEQTRQRMAELSVENLLLGLRGEPLRHEFRLS